MLLSGARPTGTVSGQSTLEPPTSPFCPDINIPYTCNDGQVNLMSWLAEPYISGNNYAPGLIHANNESMVFIEGANNHFFSNLSSIMFNSDNINVANITTILTAITSGLDNLCDIYTEE